MSLCRVTRPQMAGVVMQALLVGDRAMLNIPSDVVAAKRAATAAVGDNMLDASRYALNDIETTQAGGAKRKKRAHMLTVNAGSGSGEVAGSVSGANRRRIGAAFAATLAAQKYQHGAGHATGPGDDPEEHNGQSEGATRGLGDGGDRVSEADVARLMETMQKQWSQLSAADKKQFEERWEFDGEAGQFTDHDTTRMQSCLRQYCCYNPEHSKKKYQLLQLLRSVESAADDDIVMLEDANEVAIGLRIIQQFVIDLLGRNTPIATIFKTKAEAE
jgi:hypothetical protein